MLKSAGTSNLECTQHAVPGRKSLLACALLAMLAGNQAMADLFTDGDGALDNATITQLIIDDGAGGNSVSINGATPNVVLNSGAGTTVISTENSSFTGNLSVSGDTTATTISATDITANSVTASLNAAGTVVSNVGDGVADTDGVNVRQLNSMQGASGAALNNFANEVDSRFNAVDRRIDRVEEVAYAGIASVAALAAIPSPAYGKRFSVGAGLGNYSSESAVAVGFRAALTESTSLTAGVSRNTASKTAANLGVGYSW
jgi:autotransporter adhesin